MLTGLSTERWDVVENREEEFRSLFVKPPLSGRISGLSSKFKIPMAYSMGGDWGLEGFDGRDRRDGIDGDVMEEARGRVLREVGDRGEIALQDLFNAKLGDDGERCRGRLVNSADGRCSRRCLVDGGQSPGGGGGGTDGECSGDASSGVGS